MKIALLFLKSTFAAIITISLLNPYAFAENEIKAPTFTETAGHTFSLHTLAQDFISPVTTDAKYPLMIGTGVTALVFAFRQQLDEPVNDNFERNRPLGNSKLGDALGQMIPNLVYFSAMLGYYSFSSNSLALKRADHMFRSSMHSGVAAIILKYAFQEGRPYDNSVKTSFPSGHATSSFAFASAVATEHEWYWGASAYALATYVGLSRVNDHQHHLRDVIGGATLGISYGLGIYYRMRIEAAERSGSYDISDDASAKRPVESESFFNFLPTDDLSGAMAIYNARF